MSVEMKTQRPTGDKLLIEEIFPDDRMEHAQSRGQAGSRGWPQPEIGLLGDGGADGVDDE